jgi:hypothetical protein
LEYGDLSTFPKKRTAQQHNRHTQQRERGERENPWLVALMLSSEAMNSGKVLGKAMGQEVLSFQRRGAPLEMSSRMHQQVQVWHSGKRDRDQSGGGPSGWQAQPEKVALREIGGCRGNAAAGDTERSLWARAGGRMDRCGNEGLGEGTAG